MSKRKKIIIAVISVVLAIFLAWNIVWVVHYFNLKSYTKDIPSDGDGGYVTNDDEENSYSVKLPDYLQFNGNIALVDKDFNSLIIWVSPFDEKTYGVQLGWDDAYEMLLDENGQLLSEGNFDDAQEVYNANKQTIDKLYKYANDFWRLK